MNVSALGIVNTAGQIFGRETDHEPEFGVGALFIHKLTGAQ